MRELRARERTWTISLHPVPFGLDALDLATVPIPLPLTFTLTVAFQDAAVPVPVPLTVALPVPLAGVVWVGVSAAAAGAGANTESDRTGVRCQAEGTERLTSWARGGATGHVDWGTTEAESVASEGVTGGRGGIAHDDVAVAISLTGLPLALTIELAFSVHGHFAFPFPGDLAVAVTAEGSETEWFGRPTALIGIELCTEYADVVLVLLADFAMLCLEVVEGLADDVEFVDLARDWVGRGKSG